MSISKLVKTRLSVTWIKYLTSKLVGFLVGFWRKISLNDFGELCGKIKISIVRGIVRDYWRTNVLAKSQGKSAMMIWLYVTSSDMLSNLSNRSIILLENCVWLLKKLSCVTRGRRLQNQKTRVRKRNLVNFPESFPRRDLPVWILLKQGLCFGCQFLD